MLQIVNIYTKVLVWLELTEMLLFLQVGKVKDSFWDLVSIAVPQCVCPLMPSCNTYHLTWVSLTLDVGYVFTAAPAKLSCFSLPWMRGISRRFLGHGEFQGNNPCPDLICSIHSSPEEICLCFWPAETLPTLSNPGATSEFSGMSPASVVSVPQFQGHMPSSSSGSTIVLAQIVR